MVTKFDPNGNQNLSLGLSTKERKLLSILIDRRKRVFSLEDLRRAIPTSYANSKVLAGRLVKKKWVVRLSRGKYLVVPLSAGLKGDFTEHEYLIASHLAKPYYIGYWSAMNYHGLTEQAPSSVFVATTKVLRPRRIAGVDYRFIKLVDKKFFGFRQVAVAESHAYISDLEKTLSDSIDHPEHSGGLPQVAKALVSSKDRARFDTVVDYALRMDNSTILKRLGYLLDLLGIQLRDETQDLVRKNLRKGYSLLDPLGPKTGTRDISWRLLLNVGEETLMGGLHPR